MILDKIEVSYPRIILKYKAKFVESRKPTYIEFILIKLIIAYADREQKLINILKGELGIDNTSLFQRAMRDLINFNIVKTSEAIDANSFENYLELQLSKLMVSKKLYDSFQSKEYMISNIEKYLELKFVYDPLTKEKKIYQKIDWEKKYPDSQCVYKLFEREKIDYKIKYEDIKGKTIDLMKSDPSLFGENCRLVNIELLNDVHLDEVGDDINIYYEYENIAYKTLVNFNEKKYAIDSESVELIKYFSENKRYESEFISFVFEAYNKKIAEVIKGKASNAAECVLDNAVLMQDFPLKNKSFDFLFFNFNDLHSRSKFLERPKYIENSNIIFEYNINGDEVRIGYERKKILVATHKLKNLDEWKKASIIYVNFKKNIEAYNVEKVFIPSLKENIYVARLIPDFNHDISIDLSDTFDHIKDVFYSALKFGDYDKVALCIGLLFKLDEKNIVEKIIFERLSADIAYAREYAAIKKSLTKYNLKDEILFMEELISRIIISNKNKFSSEIFLKLLIKYNISSRENILFVLNKCDIDFSLDDLVIINSMLEKHSIDGWAININNSLTKYLHNLISSDYKLKYNESSVLNYHLDFSEKYKKFINCLNENYPYNDLVESFNELYKSELNLIQNIDQEMLFKIDYLDFIGKLLNSPLKLFKKIIISYIEMSKTSSVSKVKILAYDYIDKINSKITSMIRPNTISESFEINKTILKFSNSPDLVDEIIGDEFKLNDCMEIFYSWTFEVRDDIAHKKFVDLGGDKDE